VAISLIFYGASPLLAGGLINKNNLSAEYVRTMNRAAATDAADIVAYNPAGVMKFEDGFVANFSFQQILKPYENTFSGKTYEQDEPSTIPALYTVYKKDQWAGFFGVNVPAGGGKSRFEQGNARLLKLYSALITGFTDPKVLSESFAIGYTFGGAYQINKMFAVSLAARHIKSEKDFQAYGTISGGTLTGSVVDINYSQDAEGWGAILGLDIFPNKELTIGLKYETRTELEYEYTVHQDTVLPVMGRVLAAFNISQGTKAREDLPALFSIGVSYNITPEIRIEPTLTYYFNKDASLGQTTNPTLADKVNNSYDAGIAIEYAINENLKASLGYLYTYIGIGPTDMTPEAPELDAQAIGAGIAWKVTGQMDLNFGIGQVFYDSDVDPQFINNPLINSNVEYAKEVTFLTFGIQYKFF
nr:outer membrane protein transport protein [Candidatus Desulfatibia profunda]